MEPRHRQHPQDDERCRRGFDQRHRNAGSRHCGRDPGSRDRSSGDQLALPDVRECRSGHRGFVQQHDLGQRHGQRDQPHLWPPDRPRGSHRYRGSGSPRRQPLQAQLIRATFTALGAVILLFSLLVLFSPNADAAGPMPPQTVAIYMDNVTAYPNNLDSQGNITWRLSVDDPDQINGALTYSLYQNTTNPGNTLCSAPTGEKPACGWVRINRTYTPIAGRPGWVISSVQFALLGGTCNTGEPKYACAFNMTAWKNGVEGNPSCLLNVTLDLQGSRDQCGAYLLKEPAGISAFVQARSNATTSGNLQSKWPISVNDTNTTIGNLTYRTHVYTLTENGEAIRIGGEIDPRDANLDGNGHRINNFTIGGTARFFAHFQARAEDPLTFIFSNWTCVARVNTDILNDVSSCNGVSAFTPTPEIAQTGAIFPLVNVPAFGSKMGFDAEDSKLIFGVILMGFVAGIGVWLLGMWGGVAGAFAALGGATMMGLIPVWVTVLIFTMAIVPIVLLFNKGSDA